jgi:hypothetical protein
MNRRIGIVLILCGIGALIGSGYVVPGVTHQINLGPSLISQSQNSINLWPYISAVLCFIGILFLLNSPARREHQYHGRHELKH